MTCVGVTHWAMGGVPEMVWLPLVQIKYSKDRVWVGRGEAGGTRPLRGEEYGVSAGAHFGRWHLEKEPQIGNV